LSAVSTLGHFTPTNPSYASCCELLVAFQGFSHHMKMPAILFYDQRISERTSQDPSKDRNSENEVLWECHSCLQYWLFYTVRILF